MARTDASAQQKREGAGTRGLSARRQRRPRWRGITFRTTQPEGGD